MLISSKSRKALNFDISSNMLKKYYTSSNYRSGWNDIKLFLEKITLFIVSIQDMYLKNVLRCQKC